MLVEPIDAGTVRRGHLTYLPVVPGRLEFSLRVRRFLLQEQPKVVAVQLPRSLERLYRAAVDRMPHWSVIVIPNDEEDEAATYIPVEPGDPYVEALRTAQELGAQIILLEPPARDAPRESGHFPDASAVEIIGTQQFLEACQGPWRNADSRD